MSDPSLCASDLFVERHIGASEADIAAMLTELNCPTLEELVHQTVPAEIAAPGPLRIGPPRGEHEVLEELAALASKNRVLRSCIGAGYYDTITPGVVQRNVLENPGWYTAYTPYQAEISQGRLEALLNFQTMVSDLTALPLANASLLDEATAAAEAMGMCHALHSEPASKAFFVAQDCHPQTIAVVRTRAEAMGVNVVVGPASADSTKDCFGVLLQYPTTDGRVEDYRDVVEAAHGRGALVVAATDLLALTLLAPPGQWGCDMAVGSTQRFGVPMGLGGPHAAFLSTRPEFARKLPGRLVGVSKDALGQRAYRLAIQTREQHIRREKATSNICTAQVLPAILAVMYAVYHGPAGLKRIATRVRDLTHLLAQGLRRAGLDPGVGPRFDTLRLVTPQRDAILDAALQRGYNLRRYPDGVGVSLDETTTPQDVREILAAFAPGATLPESSTLPAAPAEGLARQSAYLTHPVFNSFHAEHEMLRYLRRLEAKDVSLCQSMIPLGSCTMKLNGTSLMKPVTWPGFSRMHPHAPEEQWAGYRELFDRLSTWLGEITGLPGVSLQPNAGSAGEYAGLLVIRAYHRSRGDSRRNVCLIPVSAHGTNPASAAMTGFEVVAVACDGQGNVDLNDLEAKAQQHAEALGALMITYPSTHGVFEQGVRRACAIVHARGGQVYMDGANMNAQVGLTSPGVIGADVCHLNLHKTFCIPHGGGGPGMGPICVAEHLRAFLPTDPLSQRRIEPSTSDIRHPTSISAARFGSASILPISYTYIALMGGPGLTRATQVAILNANYMAQRLEAHYPVLYRGQNGRVAHEFILDCRAFEKSAGVKVEDIAKRLMDFGYHAPTMSWPVAGTLMIEPTESESKAELDRFCQALILIRREIAQIELGSADKNDNPLKHAPHTAAAVASDAWPHRYSREQAAYPAPWLRQHKYWPPVARIDNAYGDRNLVCTCPPMTPEARG